MASTSAPLATSHARRSASKAARSTGGAAGAAPGCGAAAVDPAGEVGGAPSGVGWRWPAHT